MFSSFTKTFGVVGFIFISVVQWTVQNVQQWQSKNNMLGVTYSLVIWANNATINQLERVIREIPNQIKVI